MTWLELLSALGCIVYVAYAWATVLLGWARDFRWERAVALLSRIRCEAKPFRYVGVVLTYLPSMLTGRMGFWSMFSFAISLLYCYFTRNDEDDDDRWKKRREKLASKVAVVGGRLQVVPAGGPP